MQSYSVDSNCRKKLIIAIIIVSYILNKPINWLLNMIYEFIKGIIPVLSGTLSDLALFGISFNQLSILGIFGILYYWYSKYLWKTKLLIKLHNIPDLNGEWTGSLTSNYNGGTIIPMKLIVIQTWEKISLKSVFEKSESYSEAASIHINDNSGVLIRFSYSNKSKNVNLQVREYTGFNQLKYIDNTLTGFYFSNRGDGTHGEILLLRLRSV